MTCWILVYQNPYAEEGMIEIINNKAVYLNFEKAFEKLVKLNESKFTTSKTKQTNETLCFKMNDERDPNDVIPNGFYALIERQLVE